eukprot:jgi/Psemu1/57794/gm1.57794_g
MVSRSLYQMNVPVDFDDGENEEGYCELDSHADTTAAGSNMVLLNPDQITTHVDVAPFSEEYKPIKKIPIGSCAMAWTNPTSGQVYIIVFHQALYFGDKLKNSLICPNQVRDCNFNSVEETPRQFDPRSKHGITIQTPMEDDDPKKVFIKLSMRNVISYFPTRKPTRLELDECQHLIATNDTPWDPHSLKFRMAELAIDNGDPISGDQCSLQAMSTEKNQAMDTSSIVTEPASNVTGMLSKTSLDKQHPSVMQQCKLMRVHQVSTRRMLTECQIATDGNIAHRISSVRNISSARRVDQFLFDDTEFDFMERPRTSNSPHKTRRVGGSRPLRSRSGQLRLDVSAAGHPGKETTRLAWFTQHRSEFDSKQTGAIKQQQQKQQQIGRCLWLYCQVNKEKNSKRIATHDDSSSHQLSNCNEYALSGMGLLYLLGVRGVLKTHFKRIDDLKENQFTPNVGQIPFPIAGQKTTDTNTNTNMNNKFALYQATVGDKQYYKGPVQSDSKSNSNNN